MSVYRRMQIDSCFILQKSQSQMDQRRQHKTSYLESDRKEVRSSLELMGAGKTFLNRAPIGQVLRSPIDNWDLVKLRHFCTAQRQDTVIGQSSSLFIIGKDFY